MAFGGRPNFHPGVFNSLSNTMSGQQLFPAGVNPFLLPPGYAELAATAGTPEQVDVPPEMGTGEALITLLLGSLGAQLSKRPELASAEYDRKRMERQAALEEKKAKEETAKRDQLAIIIKGLEAKAAEKKTIDANEVKILLEELRRQRPDVVARAELLSAEAKEVPATEAAKRADIRSKIETRGARTRIATQRLMQDIEEFEQTKNAVLQEVARPILARVGSTVIPKLKAQLDSGTKPEEVVLEMGGETFTGEEAIRNAIRQVINNVTGTDETAALAIRLRAMAALDAVFE